MFAGNGGQTTAQGYVGDSTRQKFTGYEADAETGLNFAQARYQSPMQGRFTSADPLMASAAVTDPQTLNRYTYVRNNPVNSTDSSGMVAGRPGFSSIADFNLGDVTAAHANNDELADAQELWDYQVGETIKAAREANFLNAGLHDHTITEMEARGRAAANPLLQVQTQSPQNTDRDVRVDAAFITLGRKQIEGKVGFGGGVTFNISSDDHESFFAAEFFKVTLNLALPKGTTNLEKSDAYEGFVDSRQNSKGQSHAETADFVGGSRVTLRHPDENNYFVGKGIVNFAQVDLSERTAAANFMLHAKGGGTSNTVEVLIIGTTRSGGIKTVIPVTIIAH